MPGTMLRFRRAAGNIKKDHQEKVKKRSLRAKICHSIIHTFVFLITMHEYESWTVKTVSDRKRIEMWCWMKAVGTSYGIRKRNK